jgi:hypothetical protein
MVPYQTIIKNSIVSLTNKLSTPFLLASKSYLISSPRDEAAIRSSNSDSHLYTSGYVLNKRLYPVISSSKALFESAL